VLSNKPRDGSNEWTVRTEAVVTLLLMSRHASQWEQQLLQRLESNPDLQPQLQAAGEELRGLVQQQGYECE